MADSKITKMLRSQLQTQEQFSSAIENYAKEEKKKVTSRYTLILMIAGLFGAIYYSFDYIGPPFMAMIDRQLETKNASGEPEKSHLLSDISEMFSSGWQKIVDAGSVLTKILDPVFSGVGILGQKLFAFIDGGGRISTAYNNLAIETTRLEMKLWSSLSRAVASIGSYLNINISLPEINIPMPKESSTLARKFDDLVSFSSTLTLMPDNAFRGLPDASLDRFKPIFSSFSNKMGEELAVNRNPLASTQEILVKESALMADSKPVAPAFYRPPSAQDLARFKTPLDR